LLPLVIAEGQASGVLKAFAEGSVEFFQLVSNPIWTCNPHAVVKPTSAQAAREKLVGHLGVAKLGGLFQEFLRRLHPFILCVLSAETFFANGTAEEGKVTRVNSLHGLRKSAQVWRPLFAAGDYFALWHFELEANRGARGLKILQGSLDCVGVPGEDHVVKVRGDEVEAASREGEVSEPLEGRMESESEKQRSEVVALLDASRRL
jgi:hypothetical protein